MVVISTSLLFFFNFVLFSSLDSANDVQLSATSHCISLHDTHTPPPPTHTPHVVFHFHVCLLLVVWTSPIGRSLSFTDLPSSSTASSRHSRHYGTALLPCRVTYPYTTHPTYPLLLQPHHLATAGQRLPSNKVTYPYTTHIPIPFVLLYCWSKDRVQQTACSVS